MNEEQEKKILYLLSLKDKALAVQKKAAALNNEMNVILEAIHEFNRKFPEATVDEMDWQTKEQALAEADALFARMRVVEKELVKVDVEYEEVRTEVNDYYGREVMPKIRQQFSPEQEQDDTTDADWWKNQG
jgi:hypothetical protein